MTIDIFSPSSPSPVARAGKDIEDFGKARLTWLQGLGLFKEGLPVYDTIARLIPQRSAIDIYSLDTSGRGGWQVFTQLI
jgi:hypothetical protein